MPRSLRNVVAGQPPATAEKSATVLEAALLMKEKGKGALLVLDGSRLIGIFTERDALLRVIAAVRSGDDPARRRDDAAPANDASRRTVHQGVAPMHSRGFRHVPVVEHGRPIGIVSRATRSTTTSTSSAWTSRSAGTSATDPPAPVLSQVDADQRDTRTGTPVRCRLSMRPCTLPVGDRHSGPQPHVFGP
jgi:CBS domain-containing protein